MSEARSWNASYYDQDAVVEEYAERVNEGLLPRERQAVSEYFGDETEPILDLGCGVGRTTRPIERMGYDVVGLDLNARMLHRGRELLDEADLVVGDAAALPVRDDAFRYVLFSYNGLDYVPADERSRALAEIARVTESGGTFVFSSHNLLHRFVVDPRDPSSILDRAAFWRRNIAGGRVSDSMKLERDSNGTSLAYHGTPFGERSRLSAHGFEPVEVIPRGGVLSKYFGPWLYYAARRQ